MKNQTKRKITSSSANRIINLSSRGIFPKWVFKETLAHEETERKFLERQTLEDFGRSQIGRWGDPSITSKKLRTKMEKNILSFNKLKK